MNKSHELGEKRSETTLDHIIFLLNQGVGKRTIAKDLHERFPELFSSVEHARSFVRNLTGSGGKASHLYQLVKNIHGEYEMETPDVPIEPYIIPHKKIGIVSDIHSLHCDAKALDCAISYLASKDIDALLINGDMVDFYQLSSFHKDPTKMRFIQERKWAIDFLKMMQITFKNVYFKKSNHELRYEHYMMKNAPVIFEVPELRTIDHLFNYEGSTIKYIHPMQRVKIGKLNVFHGHEFGKGGASIINIGRRAFMKGLQNVAVGHHHKTDSFSFKDFDGHIYMGWAIGCLCTLNPDYAPVNQWNHGFAVVEVQDDEGNFIFNNKMISGGKILKA